MKTEIVNKPEDAEDVGIVVCMRLSKLPMPHRPSRIEYCAVCHERVWFAKTSPDGPPKYCVECTTAMIENDKGKDPEGWTMVMTAGMYKSLLEGRAPTTLEAIEELYKADQKK